MEVKKEFKREIEIYKEDISGCRLGTLERGFRRAFPEFRKIHMNDFYEEGADALGYSKPLDKVYEIRLEGDAKEELSRILEIMGATLNFRKFTKNVKKMKWKYPFKWTASLKEIKGEDFMRNEYHCHK